ncbi:M48 family metallopeptidase [Sedimentimonas flavescens]|uniref:M48 family metallopeptidase n=1 Tax=Sedimentimonas flavescens TaxID=2851012 RepID=A0ABT2ZXY1_9RHOB|nr:M48 family metallopeptidase [Sedimentimonas flavescens]MBW0157884.1 M48 family metallopeptidase [Sedimentimonas flavescens]MCT2540643.1 M48 family metallopeptidase [Sedimentimonas flavescens]MCV2878606.1 M48 family metallopeptidase [Sedimentimonas flavescens]WBL31796.1 M48 family metallopeptidase [Sinirhodobacter sp. HNIBRBA609]
MLRFLPFILLIAYGLALWHFSAWSLKRQLDQNSRRLRDTRLQPVLDRLAEALGVPDLPVHVFQIAPVNGLAAPDGRIFLTEGFMEKYRAGEVTPEEIGSVVAHELGHVARGHSRRRMIDFSGQNALRILLMTLLGRLLPFIGIWIANVLTTALAARLSQRDEFEADEFASALLIKAGIGVEPQISLFEKLDALTKNPGEGVPAWLLTHPKTPRRVAAIKANAQRWGAA